MGAVCALVAVWVFMGVVWVLYGCCLGACECFPDAYGCCTGAVWVEMGVACVHMGVVHIGAAWVDTGMCAYGYCLRELPWLARVRLRTSYGDFGAEFAVP